MGGEGFSLRMLQNCSASPFLLEIPISVLFLLCMNQGCEPSFSHHFCSLALNVFHYIYAC